MLYSYRAARRKARGLSDKDPTRKRREAGVGADDLLSEKRMQPKSDSEGEDDYLAPAVATRKKPPRKRAEEPVAEEPSATAPVVAAWRGSVGDTNAGDKLRKRLKDVEEAMRKKPLTKEERIRQKFYKMKTKPLPVTQGVKFRGLAGKLRKETTFIQSCGTLFKFLHTHYCYRADCFRFCVHEEIAELAHSCQAIPPVLEYLMWSLNDLYSDGYARDDSGGDIYGVNNYEFGPGIGNVKAEEHRHTNAQDDQGTLYSIVRLLLQFVSA